MRKATVSLLMTAILLFYTGCTGNISPAEPDFTKKQTLVIYTSHTEEVYAPIIKEFKERTGIWVTVETGGSNELMERILSESDSPSCDIMFGGDLVSHTMYRDCFEPYQSVQSVYLSDGYTMGDSNSTPFSAIPIVFVYNPKIVRQRDVPDSWAALLDPRWSGSVAFADPGNSAFCYSALATMMQAVNGDRWQTLESFASNVGAAQLAQSSDIPARVIDGSYLVGIALEGSAALQTSAGLDIAMLYPSDGTSLLLDCTAIVKGAPNHEAAALFLDFTISHDIQHMIASTVSRRPVRSDIADPKWLKPAADIAALEDISGWSVENRESILSRWEELTSRNEVR